MTTRNLDALFEPSAIAVIGASNRPGSVGAVLARNLLESGFAGPVMAVNPHETAIRSTLAHARVADLPVTPDLAAIATPPATVPGLIGELAAKGCRAAVVITAGFDAKLRQAMLDAARPSLLRIVGPNCLGFLSPGRGINASFAHLTPAAGGLALVAQSGAVAAAAIDWAHGKGIGFSHIVTIGDAADVDFGDLLDYLALDPQTKAILLYVESIADTRKFMTAGRIAARAKPVVVIKSGRSAAGARAAFSHTGALAGSDAVYDAAFRRAGMLRVGELRELFDAVAALTAGLRVGGDRLAVLTNGGGVGVMAADALEAQGGRLAKLTPETLAALDGLLPATWSHGDPVDIIGDAPPERYLGAVSAVLADPGVDALLVMNCPVAVADSTAAAEAVISALKPKPDHPPVLSCWLGETAVAEGRRRLAAAGVPAHETPGEAVAAFMRLVEHRRNQEMLLSTPAADPPVPPEAAAARELVRQRLAEGVSVLDPVDTAAVLAGYGVPILPLRAAATPEAAGEAAAAIGGPVALKIRSPDISHKSDLGGVALGLSGAEAVTAAAREMQAHIAATAPEARLEGFLVQAMASRPKAEELIAGVLQDAAFGPVVLFGQGGVAVEVMGDRAMGLAPLDERLARDQIARTRISRRLAGYRDRPPADLEAVAGVMVRLGRLAIDLPEVAELDINPLLADAQGVLALDARVRLADPAKVRAPAVRPYPEELVQPLSLPDGMVLTLRPIRPQDAATLVAMADLTTPQDLRLRFRAGLKTLPDAWARRLSQIDYDREMALVAEHPDGSLLAVARLAGDPEGDSAELALIVRSDWQHRGLGRAMMEALVAYAARRGLRRLWGEVEHDNRRMLELSKSLGFTAGAADQLGLVRVARDLAGG
jgi:acetyltransferase